MIELQWTENETIWINEHFWGMLSCIDERLKIIDYLMNHQSGRYALGTIRKIAEDTGLSTSTVQKYLKALQENNIIQRKGNGVYILPQAMIPVSERNEKNLCY